MSNLHRSSRRNANNYQCDYYLQLERVELRLLLFVHLECFMLYYLAIAAILLEWFLALDGERHQKGFSLGDSSKAGCSFCL